MHRNLVRDAMYGILHHCEQQRDGRYDHRYPQEQLGQMSSSSSNGELLAVALAGLRLIGELMEDKPRTNNADVLATATTAYQQFSSINYE